VGDGGSCRVHPHRAALIHKLRQRADGASPVNRKPDQRKEIRVSVTYDHGEEAGSDPLVGDADVIGLYPANRAAAASKWTSTIGDPDNSSGLDD
jgi:hypothetical protein